jgi:hypothetical protein
MTLYCRHYYWHCIDIMLSTLFLTLCCKHYYWHYYWHCVADIIIDIALSMSTFVLTLCWHFYWHYVFDIVIDIIDIFIDTVLLTFVLTLCWHFYWHYVFDIVIDIIDIFIDIVLAVLLTLCCQCRHVAPCRAPEATRSSSGYYKGVSVKPRVDPFTGRKSQDSLWLVAS